MLKESHLCCVCHRRGINVGRNDNVVEIRFGEQDLEEGVGVAQAVLLDEGSICGKAISPV